MLPGLLARAGNGAELCAGVSRCFLASCVLDSGRNSSLQGVSTQTSACSQASGLGASFMSPPFQLVSQQRHQAMHCSSTIGVRGSIDSSSSPSCSYIHRWPNDPYCGRSCWSSNLGPVRGQKVLRRVFSLPPAVQAMVDAKVEQTQAQKLKEPPPIPQPSPQPLAQDSRRVGCIAYKAGMTHEWDEHGVRVPLTLLWIDNCQVVGLKWEEKHGYNAMMVGAGHSKQKSLHPGFAGYFIKHELPFKRRVAEFPVSVDARLPIGFEVTSAHYVPGQTVDIVGWTKWKGFQGVMKKWNFKGMPATHGTSLSHRHGGAIGGRTDPGRVWKGKKMPGNMGDERRTVHDCLVYKVDTDRNLVYVRGQVPGPAGRMVLLRDAYNVQHDVRKSWGLPFPTFLPAAGAEKEGRDAGNYGVKVYQQTGPDPYRAYSDDSDYFGVKWKKTD